MLTVATETIQLTGRGDGYTLTVTDNGKGMDEKTLQRRDGMGPGLMEYRSRLSGVHLDITSASGRGTTRSCSFDK